MQIQTHKIDELVRSHLNRWLCKEAKFKAREARGVRRTLRTPQRQRAEAQRRNWTIYEAIKIVGVALAPGSFFLPDTAGVIAHAGNTQAPGTTDMIDVHWS